MIESHSAVVTLRYRTNDYHGDIMMDPEPDWLSKRLWLEDGLPEDTRWEERHRAVKVRITLMPEGRRT